MWELKATPKTHKVTAKLAAEFAGMEAVSIDRPLSTRRLGVYEKLVREGGMRPVTWARAWCVETGQWYRVNGKHTSTLYSLLDLATIPDQFVIIEEYRCDNLTDVAHLYATFDSKTMSRTMSDINRSFAAAIPGLADLDVWTLNMLVSGLAYADNPTASYSDDRTTAERAELLFDNVEVCLWVCSIITHGSHKCAHLDRAPVVAAMMGTWRRNRAEATKFWTAVRDETGTSPEVPDRKLARWLMQMRINRGARPDVPKRFKRGPKEFYVKSIHAWNAWRKGEQTNLQYRADKPVPSIR